MGSRIMHFIISERLIEQIPIKNKQSFLLGGIAPDAVSPKGLSHFYAGQAEDFTRHIAFESFYNKYSNEKDQDYILGYYTHLLADNIWLKGFYLPWLKNRMENDENVFRRYHHDFRLLNGKLLDYYGIGSDRVDTLAEHDLSVDLEEVKAADVKKLLVHVQEDTNYSQQDLGEKLSVFTFEQMLGYIETAVELNVFQIKVKNSDK